jgi:hypothetical protein
VPAVPFVLPQLVPNMASSRCRQRSSIPSGSRLSRKSTGVRGLVVFDSDGTLQTRNRRGIRRDWLRGDAFEQGLRRLREAADW